MMIQGARAVAAAVCIAFGPVSAQEPGNEWVWEAARALSMPLVEGRHCGAEKTPSPLGVIATQQSLDNLAIKHPRAQLIAEEFSHVTSRRLAAALMRLGIRSAPELILGNLGNIRDYLDGLARQDQAAQDAAFGAAAADVLINVLVQNQAESWDRNARELHVAAWKRLEPELNKAAGAESGRGVMGFELVLPGPTRWLGLAAQNTSGRDLERVVIQYIAPTKMTAATSAREYWVFVETWKHEEWISFPNELVRRCWGTRDTDVLDDIGVVSVWSPDVGFVGQSLRAHFNSLRIVTDKNGQGQYAICPVTLQGDPMEAHRVAALKPAAPPARRWTRDTPIELGGRPVPRTSRPPLPERAFEPSPSRMAPPPQPRRDWQPSERVPRTPPVRPPSRTRPTEPPKPNPPATPVSDPPKPPPSTPAAPKPVTPDTKKADGLMSLADTYLRNGLPDHAKEIWRQVIREYPGSAQARLAAELLGTRRD
ncbi:MAG: hypothetical protein KF864_02780 [Phycisphaeraceae bacterium]|nr:hypothetical protein [Phycisphaeraceae bacterium]